MPADLRPDLPRKGFGRRRTIRSNMEDSFPDLGSLSDAELKELIQKLTEEEEKVSYTPPHPARQDRHSPGGAGQPPAQEARRGRSRDHRRRRAAAHRHPRRDGRWARPTRRTTEPPGRWKRVERRSTAPSAASSTTPGPTSARSAVRICAVEEQDGDQTTITYKVDETGELRAGRPRGGRRDRGWCAGRADRRGRAGETFPIEGERVTIGRSPEAERVPRRRDRVAQPRAAGASGAMASTWMTSAR